MTRGTDSLGYLWSFKAFSRCRAARGGRAAVCQTFAPRRRRAHAAAHPAHRLTSMQTFLHPVELIYAKKCGGAAPGRFGGSHTGALFCAVRFDETRAVTGRQIFGGRLGMDRQARHDVGAMSTLRARVGLGAGVGCAKPNKRRVCCAARSTCNLASLLFE
jgi:hypothetical protein